MKNRWYIDVNASNSEDLSNIRNYINKYTFLPFQEWTEEIDSDLSFFLEEMSFKFKNHIFSLQYHGDLGLGKEFYFMGNKIKEKDIFPIIEFPPAFLVKTYLVLQNLKQIILLFK